MPKDILTLRYFLSWTGYYMRFVNNYGLITKSLTFLLNENFECTQEVREVFENSKRAMPLIVVLALPNFGSHLRFIRMQV